MVRLLWTFRSFLCLFLGTGDVAGQSKHSNLLPISKAPHIQPCTRPCSHLGKYGSSWVFSYTQSRGQKDETGLRAEFLGVTFGLVFGSVGMWVSPADVNGGRGCQVDERVVGGKGATVCSSSQLQPRVRQQILWRGQIFHNQMSYPDGRASWQPPARHFMGPCTVYESHFDHY